MAKVTPTPRPLSALAIERVPRRTLVTVLSMSSPASHSSPAFEAVCFRLERVAEERI